MKPTRGLPPAPIVFPGDEPFWEATRRGELLAKRCTACDALHYYPRMHCPFCGSDKTAWHKLSGEGRIHSHSIVARSPRPMAPAIVETPEGLRIHTVIVDADVQSLRIDDPVTLRFVNTQDGPPAPAFTTLAAEQARAYTKAARAALGPAGADDATRFQRAAVIGGGNMGVGIALALLAAGLPVQLVDNAAEAAASARQRIADGLQQDLTRGRITAEQVAERLTRLNVGTDMAAVAEADVVIEAVWEDLALKREIFAQLDQHARPGVILATNTSTLDVGQIAAATQRPEAVVGLHFFNPAHIMKLLEVVRAPATSAATLDGARAVARLIGNVPVVVGICDGFVGNRLMITRERQAARLLLEGALPEQIDRVLRGVGLPMGTFELQDMAGGIELTYRARQRDGRKDWLIEQLHARGRTGLRAGRGYYRYEPGKRRPLVDPEVTALIEEASRVEGIARRAISDAEIHDRLILPMINEGAKLVMEGMVDRASDIDLVWHLGYGWPDWKGGPMYYADQLGLAHVVQRLDALHAEHGEVFRPAQLLRELAPTATRISSCTPSLKPAPAR